MSLNLAKSIIKSGADAQISIASELRSLTGKVVYGPVRCHSTDSRELPCTESEKKQGCDHARETYTHCRVSIGLCCGSTPRGYLVKELRKDGTPALIPRIWPVSETSTERPDHKSWVNVARIGILKNKRASKADPLTHTKCITGWE
jgi:hypothetical protein